MDDIALIDKIKRLIEAREKQIQETLMSGGLKDIEHYKYLQGELSALYYIANELGDIYKGRSEERRVGKECRCRGSTYQ